MDSREPREDHELAAFRKWARQVSVAFVNLSGGGSEMFTLIGNEFYVDPDPCAARIKEKIDAARLRRPSPVAESTPAAPANTGRARVLEEDILYLVRLADWAAGNGFGEIEGIEDPEEWCFRKWSELGPSDGSGYSAEALATALSTPTDATAVEAERDGDKCACFCPTDECQRVCTLDCPNAGARIPPRQADMADAQKAESTPSPDTEGVAMEGAESVVQRWREIDRKAGTDTNDEDEDSYNIGVRDGFQEAVQTLDLLTGGDGEYRFCTDKDPERHCPDPVFMIRNILDRFALRTAQNTGRDEVLEEAARVVDRATVHAEGRSRESGLNGILAELVATTTKAIGFEIRALKSSPPVSTVDEEGGGL